jgi:hypothetical protein
VQLPSLKVGVNRLEDAIITLSGPALAISGIIAGVDLLTGGTMMRSATWLVFAWAVFLLVSLDFQVLALGARAHKVYLSMKPTGRKAFEICLALALAAGISYVSIQIQSIIARSNSVGISVEQATLQLGINPIALTWERSALVLLLIFMSGWFREEQTVRQTEQQIEQERTPGADTLTIEEEAQPQPPALPAPNVTGQESEQPSDTGQDIGVDTGQERTPGADIGKKLRIDEYLQSNPAATAGDIASACQVSRSYAGSTRAEWKKRNGIQR